VYLFHFFKAFAVFLLQKSSSKFFKNKKPKYSRFVVLTTKLIITNVFLNLKNVLTRQNGKWSWPMTESVRVSKFKNGNTEK